MVQNLDASIFIPVYNAEQTVQQAIESVLVQTWQNYELLIINDASTDDTAAIINRYQHHPRVKIYHNPHNLGVTGNWNLGVSLCRGDVIARLDADDYYAPTWLENVMAAFEQPSEPAMVFTGAWLVFDDGQSKVELPYQESWLKNGAEFLPEAARYCPIRASTVCIKRSCYERLGGVKDELAIHHDWEFWVRLAATNNSVGYIAKPLSHYRVLHFAGCTSQAITQATSPADCAIWLEHLADGKFPYHLNTAELRLLKQGMYDIVMMFAVYAMEQGNQKSVAKHLAFARTLLPPEATESMQSRLYARAAEIHFIEDRQRQKGWRYLIKAVLHAFPLVEHRRFSKLWTRALLGNTIYNFIRRRIATHRDLL